MMTEGSRSIPPGPVKGTASTIRDAFLRFVTAIRLQQLPSWSLATRLGCPPLASSLIRLSAFEEQTMNEIRILQLDDYDARARPTELETLSRAGAVARFALRRFDPPGEPRRFLHRRPGRTSRYVASLYALCAFRDRAGSRFRYEPTAHLPGCDVPGTSPDCATFDDGAHHFFTTRRLATTRRAIMASDVGRGLREAACRQPKVPCAPTPQGSGTTRDPLLARGPEHPMSLARVRDRLDAEHGLA